MAEAPFGMDGVTLTVPYPTVRHLQLSAVVVLAVVLVVVDVVVVMVLVVKVVVMVLVIGWRCW